MLWRKGSRRKIGNVGLRFSGEVMGGLQFFKYLAKSFLSSFYQIGSSKNSCLLKNVSLLSMMPHNSNSLLYIFFKEINKSSVLFP